MISNHTSRGDVHLYFFSDMSVVGRGKGWGVVADPRGRIIERNNGGVFLLGAGALLDSGKFEIPKPLPLSLGDEMIVRKLRTQPRFVEE